MAYATVHIPSLFVTHLCYYYRIRQCLFDLSKKSRRKSVFHQHLLWHVFATHHSICLPKHHNAQPPCPQNAE